MLVPEEFFSWDARENKAITRLCPVLEEVIVRGRPSDVECFPATLTNREFIAIAVDVCKRAELNVAVLGNQARNAITLVPLVTGPPLGARPRAKAPGPLVGAGSTGDIFI